MNPPRLIFLGTGTGEPAPDRAASGLAVISGDSRALIDVGDGVARNWVRYLGDAGGLETIIVTHLHPDHVSGLPYLIQGLHLSGRSRPLDLYSPPGTQDRIDSLLDSVRLDPERLGFPLRRLALADAEIGIGDLTVRPCPNTHLPPDSAGRPQSYSLLLTHGQRRAVYSSDLGNLSDLDRLTRLDLDILIVEITHFSPEDVLQFIRTHPPRRLVFTHVDGKVSRQQIEALGLKSGPGRIDVAEDGLEVDLL